MEVIRELGRGTFGVVSEAKMNSRSFAVKMVDFDGQKELKTTLKETKILKLLDHPLLINFHTVEVTDTRVLIVMDLIRGITLRDIKYSNPEGKLTSKELKPIFAEIICSLSYLQSLEIIHNDLKPENIGLTLDGHVKLIDFGSACFVKDEIKEVRGSLGYIAPEVLKRQGCSFKSDIWSLGCTTFEVSTGIKAFESYKSVFEEEPEFPTSEDPNFETLIFKMLSKDPNDRYSIADIKESYFFTGLDWDLADKGNLKPLFLPESKEN